MKKIISWMLPKERKILGVLSSQSESVFDMAKKLEGFIANYPQLERKDRKEIAYSIRGMNGKIEGIGSHLMPRLNREELHQIAMLLNEIAEVAGECAMRFVVLGIERIDVHTTKLAALFTGSTEELMKLMSMKKPNSIKSHYERLSSLKLEGQEAYDEALSELFHFYKNSIDIMKYREIYELLKKGIKKCASAAEALEFMAARSS